MNYIVTDEKALQLKNHVLFTKLDFICDAPKLDRHIAEEIRELSVAYTEGICNVVNIFFKGDWIEFARWLEFLPEHIDVIDKFSCFSTQSTYMRVDIAGTAREPRMVELNAGPNVGGLGYSIAHRICHPGGNTDPLYQWAQWVRQAIEGQFIEGSQFVAIVEDTRVLKQIEPIATLMVEELIRLGIDAQLVSHRDLELKQQRLFVSEKQVTHIYCLFDLVDVVNAPEEYQPLYQALENQQVFLPVGFEGRLIGNKLCMTLVHDERFRHCFDEDLYSKLQTFIPYTWRLSKEKLMVLLEQRTDWIIKPAHGYGGNDILCGWEVDQNEWELQLNTILECEFPYVIQRRVAIPEYPIVAFSSEQQKEYSMEAKCLLGIYMMNNVLGGGWWRASRHEQSDIINISQGSIAGNVILQDGIE
ncbi:MULTISPECIES: hypothetical protein [Photorhabdus]|uniref:Glutathionylspermidine synthase pre-ATP-grasp-like domain-containing protein n=1 Tax=Photorhabdus bodei TaxID=2029681 RepID=A0ABX0AYE2_9GAMM|nr:MULTISPECIES: hypothetical protein [Photorhabdus]NDL01320.1 hypothetical protein [Photorhabdus bodei]NDL05609.1 hypothetical protein [Photorhabdus bodei]NDL09802.1 hypothetical protein [Photorhabdus bodei]